jgi:hypothetical protein
VPEGQGAGELAHEPRLVQFHAQPVCRRAAGTVGVDGRLAAVDVGQHQPHGLLAQHAHAVVLAAVDEHLPHHGQVESRAEEAGVRGHPAHGVGDLVVHRAPQQPPVRPGVGGDEPRRAIGRRQPGQRLVAGFAQAQRPGELRGDELAQRPAGDLLDQLAEHQQPQAGVPHGGTGHRARQQRRAEHGGRVTRLAEFQADRQPAGVREQHRHGHLGLAPTGEPRQVPGDGRVDGDLTAVDLAQHEQRCEHLGDRGQVEHRVGAHRDPPRGGKLHRALPVPDGIAGGPVHRDLPVDRHQHHRTGMGAVRPVVGGGALVTAGDREQLLPVRRGCGGRPHRASRREHQPGR